MIWGLIQIYIYQSKIREVDEKCLFEDTSFWAIMNK